MTFHVGQRVVCVKNALIGGYGDEIRPVCWKVYKVRGFGFFNSYQKPFLLVDEIINKVRHYHGEGFIEPGYVFDHFRPVRETDISIFTDILAASQVPA